MRVPVHGNNAYKYDTFETTNKNIERRKKSMRKAKVVKRKKAAIANALSIMIFTSLAFCLLFRYALITEQCSEVARLKTQLEDTNSIMVEKEFDRDRQIDLKTIEQIATSKLGMKRPEKYQIVYIDLENDDYAQVIQKDKNQGSLGIIMGGLSKVLEYLD